MNNKLVINASIKDNNGTGAARHIRSTGRIPAIIYGFDQTMISISYKEFIKEYFKGDIMSQITYLKLNDIEIPALIRDVQIDPVTDNPIHIDFQQISFDKPIKIKLGISVINENKCIGIKKGGVLNIVQRFLDFYCMPDKLIKSLPVDISDLQIGHSIHISDLKLPEGITPVTKTDLAILSISGQTEEEKA
jgi:large subunit ribosomal protein L25